MKGESKIKSDIFLKRRDRFLQSKYMLQSPIRVLMGKNDFFFSIWVKKCLKIFFMKLGFRDTLLFFLSTHVQNVSLLVPVRHIYVILLYCQWRWDQRRKH